MKDAEKIRALEQHKTRVVASVRDNSVPGRRAGVGGKRGVSQPVRPFDGTAIVNQLCCLPAPHVRQLILTELSQKKPARAA